MLKKILFLTTLLLTMLVENASAIPMSSGYTDKEPQIHGTFKIYLDKRNNIAITRTEKLNSKISRMQALELTRGYNREYLKQKTPEDKAQLAYRLIQKVAARANFKVEVRSTPVYKQTLRLTIFSTDDMGGSTNRLLPEKDMNTVMPIILKLIKSNPKPTISSKYYKWDDTMPALTDWPKDEEWYPDWEDWVMDELRNLCTGASGESLCTGGFGTDLYDLNGDGENDTACGYYFGYFGYNEDEYHCISG